jgi:hypothetical protein
LCAVAGGAVAASNGTAWDDACPLVAAASHAAVAEGAAAEAAAGCTGKPLAAVLRPFPLLLLLALLEPEAPLA